MEISPVLYLKNTDFVMCPDRLEAVRMISTYAKLEKLLPALSTSELSKSDLLDS